MERMVDISALTIRALSIHAKMVVTVRPMALEDTVVHVLRELEEKTAQKMFLMSVIQDPA